MKVMRIIQHTASFWNDSSASGKTHGRRMEDASKLLGRPNRPNIARVPLVSEG